jgi:outer membrane protein assembly factor BamA
MILKGIYFLVLFSGLFSAYPAGGQTHYLEKIDIYGNNRTHSQVILQELDLNSGKALTDSLLRMERAWLLRLDFLKRIEFQVRPGSSLDRLMLMVVVQEKDIISVSPIFEIKEVYGWFAGTRIKVRNFLGRRNLLELLLHVGDYQQYGFSWCHPRFGGCLSLFAGLELNYQQFRYGFKDYHNTFTEKDTRIKGILGKTWHRKTRTGLSGGNERIWVEDPAVTFSSSHSDHLWFIGPFFEFDSRDWPFYPGKGVYLKTWFNYYRFSKAQLFQQTGMDFRCFLSMFRKNIVAFQSYLSLSIGDIPIYKRVHLGGGSTLRGYSTGALCGENSFLGSFEYRFPLVYEGNPLAGLHAGYSGFFFVDVAGAWFQEQPINMDLIRASAGVGVYFIWDHWVFRAEYGYNGRSWGFANVGTGVKF